MRFRAISWLAWSLAALCVVSFLVAVALQIDGPGRFECGAGNGREGNDPA
jgi:hypothetical protein